MPMLSRVWEFIYAVLQHWIVLMTGGVVIASITYWSWRTGKAVNRKLGSIIAGLFILIACFNVWDEQRTLVGHKKEGTICEFRFMFKGSNTTPKGLRYWQALHDGRLWIELYPDNRYSLFSILKRSSSAESANGCTGTILLKDAITGFDRTDKAYSYTEFDNTQTTQFFLPDIGCNTMHIYSRATITAPWIDWGEMLDLR